ncbi:AAA family ATPase [Pasteurella multocida]|uniref:AAA family ATPase n=1 Tax=Pasteurella multocida TaxID=747 RepID=UPI00287A8E98|nr:AAA family ATPase [Pasteurella multocida]HDX1087811.1 AAA family ATPase [Pasteurella multocida]HDX1088383.1 AAA family ATPase [Pasteurella multocida]HEA3262949.1 AAA family ATPase [Pasteurella multocida]
MDKSLEDIAKKLYEKANKVQVIYAFNSTGKTRLSQKFIDLVSPKGAAIQKLTKKREEYKKIKEETKEIFPGQPNNRKNIDSWLITLNDKKKAHWNRLDNKRKETLKEIFCCKKEIRNPLPTRQNILYYNAFTEDIFYWNNGVQDEPDPILKIQKNKFISRILYYLGDENRIEEIFKTNTNREINFKFSKLNFNKKELEVPIANEVIFSREKGDNTSESKIKISKGEERYFIWSIFYALIIELFERLDDEDNDVFQKPKYIFIDDPVSSLDDNHLIELAVQLATLIKENHQLGIKFILTTHNPLFYNVLFNELSRSDNKYNYSHNNASFDILSLENNNYTLKSSNDSPFSYHIYLRKELQKAISEPGNIKKFHFHFLRQILEKLATFLGYKNWADLISDAPNHKYIKRLLDFSSHAKHSGEEMVEITSKDKDELKNIIEFIDKKFKFNNN